MLHRTTLPLSRTLLRRNVVFVRGERVKGLLRDPEEVLSSNGAQYGATEANLAPLKAYLGKEYPLPDSLLLQVITHKSFAHGSKPYNEKLSFFGERLLKLAACKLAVDGESTTARAVAGHNFDSLGSLTQRLIVTDRVMSEFAIQQGLDKVFFCRLALPNGEQRQDYKPKRIYSTITSSLVGAVALQYGKEAAERFVGDRVIKSVLELVKEVS